MSARVAAENTRQKLRGILFWVGIGLAPIAALLLLIAEGDSLLRIVAVLAVLAVVLIGLSITLRGDDETIRLSMHKTLLEEIDMLREELRNDVTRAAHHAVGERLQLVHDDVAALREQLLSGRGEAWTRGSAAAESTRLDAEDRARADRPPRDEDAPTGGLGEPEEGWRSASARVSPAGLASGDGAEAGWHAGGQGARAAAAGRAQVRASAAIPRPRPPVSGALVQHTETTETVQVTTRHTIVEQSAADASGGYGRDGYGGGHRDPAADGIGGPGVYGPSEPRRGEDWPESARDEDRWARPYGERAWSDESRLARESAGWADRDADRDAWARDGRAAARVEARDADRWSARETGWSSRDDNRWTARDDNRWSARGEERWSGWSDQSWRAESWRGDGGADWRADQRWGDGDRWEDRSGEGERRWAVEGGRGGWRASAGELPSHQWSSAGSWSTGATSRWGAEPEREPVGRRYRDGAGEVESWRPQTGRYGESGDGYSGRDGGYGERFWR